MKKIRFNHLLLIAISASVAVLAGACKKKSNNEEELITTVRLVLKNKATLTEKTYEWKDLDGSGGNNPVPADTLRLDSGATYEASLMFLNQSGGKNEDITTEIRNEGKDHLICFTSSGASNIAITRTDSDGKYPIGLLSDWKAEGRGSGQVRVVLRHQPGVKNGECDPGDTDADVGFAWQSK